MSKEVQKKSKKPQKKRAKAEVSVGDAVLPASAALEDRSFRNAWKLSGDVIEVDMAAARDIHREGLRRARRPLFEQLDVAWMKALEREDAAQSADVLTKKRRLRDVTNDPRIDEAKTPDELKKLTIDHLLEN